MHKILLTGGPKNIASHSNNDYFVNSDAYISSDIVAEAYSLTCKQEYDLAYIIFRFLYIYSPNQTAMFVLTRYITTAVRKEPVTLYRDGAQTQTLLKREPLMLKESIRWLRDYLHGIYRT